jgi:translation elongation factor EF-G
LARFRQELLETAKSAHEALVELVAEGKDELMEEYFAEGTIPEEHLIAALHEAIREDRIFPVLFASGAGQYRADRLLEFLASMRPRPWSARRWRPGRTPDRTRPSGATATLRRIVESLTARRW